MAQTNARRHKPPAEAARPPDHCQTHSITREILCKGLYHTSDPRDHFTPCQVYFSTIKYCLGTLGRIKSRFKDETETDNVSW